MPIQLPAKPTVEGAVTRLLMAEARGPSAASYVEADSKTAMQWMVVVLDNRLKNNPGQFMAPNAKTLLDIIKAPKQFAGFSTYPNYDASLVNRLQAMLDIANAVKDKRSALYTTFIQNAINVGKAAPIADPCVTAGSKRRLCGWRTGGSGSPGGRFMLYKSFNGNDFYSLEP